jgi:hypothetical protein
MNFEFIESGIEVVLVGMPHHPRSYPILDDGQWDGYNTTAPNFLNLTM